MDGTAKPETPRDDYEAALHQDDRLELRVWLRLLTCATLIEGEVRSRLREGFDVTLPRFDMLAQLDRAPEGLTMGELSGRLMVSAGNVTGLVERLAQEGLVSRSRAPGDRRAVRVRLTRAGKTFFDSMTPEHERWIDALMAGLDREDLARLHDLLAKLKQSVTTAKDGRTGQ